MVVQDNNNPLRKYFRQPKIYLRLPSKGKFYPASIIDMPESGELPVFAMTAKDELMIKTPDALLKSSLTLLLADFPPAPPPPIFSIAAATRSNVTSEAAFSNCAPSNCPPPRTLTFSAINFHQKYTHINIVSYISFIYWSKDHGSSRQFKSVKEVFQAT